MPEPSPATDPVAADVITSADRDHPGYQRHCIRPDCTAAFNILDLMAPLPGQVPPQGWHYAPRIFQGYLCPDHWGTANEHLPEWVRVGDKVTGCRCECDRWMWLPGHLAVTLGAYQERYVQHLVAIDEARSTDDRH